MKLKFRILCMLWGLAAPVLAQSLEFQFEPGPAPAPGEKPQRPKPDPDPAKPGPAPEKPAVPPAPSLVEASKSAPPVLNPTPKKRSIADVTKSCQVYNGLFRVY